MIRIAITFALLLGFASPVIAADPEQPFITKSQYEANVLPWGKGTDFVKDKNDQFWIIHKHMPPMRARVDGVPVFPLDEQMWEAAKLEHAKKLVAAAKPAVEPAANPLPKLGGDWADGFDGLISVIEQAKEAAANGDPSLLADVRASLAANQAALRVVYRKPDDECDFAKLGQWLKAMPLPRVIANPFRAMLGR